MRESCKAPIAVVAGLALLLFLPIAYVLSSGPALALLYEGRLSDTTWDTVYFPLRCNLGPLNPPLRWYWDQWTPPLMLPTPVVDPEA